MINAVVFDFGNVFINLDIEGALKKTHQSLNINGFSKDLLEINNLYEQGLVSTDAFLGFYLERFPKLSKEELINIWNSILKDFPKYRLEFLKDLRSSASYKLILLSNTNELHMNWIMENITFYHEFKECFDAFYLSHEINLRKPNQDIFKFVLNGNNLSPNECLFIDDNLDNIKTANAIDFKTWHINPNTEDVVDLLKTKSYLF